MLAESHTQKQKDAKIIQALREQVAKLKSLAELKTAVVQEDRRLKQQLDEQAKAKKILEERVETLESEAVEKGKDVFRLQARLDR